MSELVEFVVKVASRDELASLVKDYSNQAVEQSLVTEELLEALEELMSIVSIHSRATNNNFAWAEMELAQAAIVKARGIL